MQFTKGKVYPALEIVNEFGGNPNAEMPARGGRVTCLRLDPQRHPGAPYILFITFLERDKLLGERLLTQGGRFPVFILNDDGGWVFRGLFESKGFSDGKREIQRYHEGSTIPVQEIYRVLFLDEVGGALVRIN